MLNRFFHSYSVGGVGYLHDSLGKSEASYRVSALIFGILIMSQNVSIIVNVSHSKCEFLTKFYILNIEMLLIKLNV